MLKLSEKYRPHPAPDGRISDDFRHYCGLFEDMITEGLCRLRWSELHSSGSLSCGGCSKDIFMRSRGGRRRARLVR